MLYLIVSRDSKFNDKPKKMTQYAHRYESIPRTSGQLRSLSLQKSSPTAENKTTSLSAMIC